MNKVAPITGSTWIMLIIVGLSIAFFLSEAAAAPGLSDDAALRHLVISEGTLTPAFDPEVTAYTAEVDNAVDSINVSAVPRDEGATLIIDGDFAESGEPVAAPLAVGANPIGVTGVAEDSTTKTYTVTVTRDEP